MAVRVAALASVTLALLAAAPAAAGWVRPEGQRQSRVVTGQADRPPPMLGGLDLNQYCRKRGYESARLDESGWLCIGAYGRTSIDMDDACRDAFGAEVRARQMSDSPMSWVCFGEIQPAPVETPAGPQPTTPGMDGAPVPPGAVPVPPGTPPPSGPPIFGVPPSAVPPAVAPATPAEAAPSGPLGLWTGLPFYARAVIAGLGALVLGLLLGTMVRRRAG